MLAYLSFGPEWNGKEHIYVKNLSSWAKLSTHPRGRVNVARLTCAAWPALIELEYQTAQKEAGAEQQAKRSKSKKAQKRRSEPEASE